MTLGKHVATKPFTPEVRKRWRAVKRAILAWPTTYAQYDYGNCADNGGRLPSCESPACLAGWFWFFTPSRDRAGVDYDQLIGKACGFGDPYAIGGQDACLRVEAVTDGSADAWPEPSRSAYKDAVTAGEKARAAAQRIDYLLREGR